MIGEELQERAIDRDSKRRGLAEAIPTAREGIAHG